MLLALFSFMKSLSSKSFWIAIALIVFAFSGVFASSFWHSFAYKTPFSSYSLESFDLKTTKNSNTCFSLLSTPFNYSSPQNIEVKAFLGETLLLKDYFELHETPLQKNYCFSSASLSEGDNLIEVFAGSEKLFFHVSLADSLLIENPSVEIVSLSEKQVDFKIENFAKTKYVPAYVYVDSIEVAKFYPVKSSETFSQKLLLSAGIHEVKVEFFSSSASKEIEVPNSFSSNFLLGAIFFIFAFLVFSFFVFSKKEFVEKTVLSIASIFALFALNGFALNALNILSLFSFFALLLLELIAFAYFFRKSFSFGEKFSLKEISFIHFLFVLLLVFVAVFLHLFSVTQYSHWSNFYERESNAVIESFSIPLNDELSYLGRGFSFVPGYFLIEAGLSWLFGVKGDALFALVLAFVNVFFVFSALFFSRKILSNKQSLFFVLLLYFSVIVFAFASVTPRHLLALSFMFVSLALLLDNRKIFSSFFLAITAFIQLPLVLIFFFLYLFVSKKIEWKKLFFSLLSGLGLFFLLYLPQLARFGLLTQERPFEWGYLIRFPFESVVLTYGVLGLFFAGFLLYFLFQKIKYKKLGFSFLQKKILLGVFTALIVHLLVTSRFDIAVISLLALFIAFSLNAEKEFFESLSMVFSALVVLVAFVSLSLLNSSVLPEQLLSSSSYISSHSVSSQNILPDPYFGHVITFFAQRPVLADLWVEYADTEKLDNAFNFFKEKDYSILSKYSIDFVFNQNTVLNEKIVSPTFLPSPLEFPKLSKVYSNGFIYVHRAF